MCKYVLSFCQCFHFLDGIFWSTKTFNFDKVEFIYFFVCHLYSWYHFWENVANSRSLALRLGSCFELIFEYRLRWASSFILLHVDMHLFQHHLSKRLSRPHWNGLGTLVKTQLTINLWVYFWTLLNSIQLIYRFILMSVPTVLIIRTF